MKYTKQYMETRDIDCFAMLVMPNGRKIPIHFASRGNILPDFINNIERNRSIQFWTANRGFNFDVKQAIPNNIDLLDNNVTIEDYNRYFITFGEMAMLGFYSYDCICTEGNELMLKLIARPKDDNQLMMCENILPIFSKYKLPYGEGLYVIRLLIKDE